MSQPQGHPTGGERPPISGEWGGGPEVVTDRKRAEVLLHPLRQRILEEAREPVSAAHVGRRLGVARQKVNYHMGALFDAGFLRDAGERRRGNLVERRYVATAPAYVLASEVLGPVGAGGPTPGDTVSAGRLVGLAARLQSEVGRAMEAAARKEKRVSTFSLDAELRFSSPEQRAGFARALQAAVMEVVSRHAEPYSGPDGTPGRGRPYRLVLGVHPIPPSGGTGGAEEKDGRECGDGGAVPGADAPGDTEPGGEES